MFKRFEELQIPASEQRKLPSFKLGIPYLDDATGGIRQSDLVVIGGRSGAGKTELASIIAENIARQSKNVYLFSLESEKAEAYNRILFRNYARRYYDKTYEKIYYKEFIQNKNLNYDLLVKCENEILSACSSLEVFERDDKFTLEDFDQQVMLVSKDADLIIVDHLHHFDSDSNDEVRALKETVKAIRDKCLFYNKPIILIAHFRKADKRIVDIVPEMEEFYGSSEISKEATIVITMAGYFEEVPIDDNYPTLFKICKDRIDGGVTRYVGKHYFSGRTKVYSKEYQMYRLEKGGKGLTEIAIEHRPSWSNAI